MEALSFVRLMRRLLPLLVQWSCAAAAAGHPALIPLPTSVTWNDGSVAIGAGTVIEARGEAAPTAAYLARELALKQGARGASRSKRAGRGRAEDRTGAPG